MLHSRISTPAGLRLIPVLDISALDASAPSVIRNRSEDLYSLRLIRIRFGNARGTS